MIGWIMVTLVTQWFVIFFEAKEVCADFLLQGDLSDQEFKTRQRWVKTLEGTVKLNPEQKNNGIMILYKQLLRGKSNHCLCEIWQIYLQSCNAKKFQGTFLIELDSKKTQNVRKC